MKQNLFAVTLLSALLSACVSDTVPTESSSALSVASSSEAASTNFWAEKCQTCHGTKGEGTNGYAVLSFYLINNYATQADLANIIATTMPIGEEGTCTDACADTTAAQLRAWFPVSNAPSSQSIASSSSAFSSINTSSSSTPNDVMPAIDPNGAPVSTPRPNADNLGGQSPAFKGQTRVPEQKSPYSYNITNVTSSLSAPWALAILPDGRFLITEKPGTMVIVTPDGKVSSDILGVPSVVYQGNSIGVQGGLLDVTLAPDFATSRTIFLSYAEPRPNNRQSTTIARARLSNDETALENVEVILRQNPDWNNTLQFGSRFAWDREGHLYITFGDRSDTAIRTSAQDNSTLIGKVVRINTDGTPVTGNPFIGQANKRPEIWSYGHRNPQGAAIHPVTGELWTVEHGARGGDELNRPEGGKNYGWPNITYGIDYSGARLGEATARAGTEQPVYYWDPVIAPSNMIFYKGDMFSGWNGNLLIGALSTSVKGLARLVLEGNQVVAEERILNSINRIRDLEVDAAGALWLVTDGGQLIKVTKR